MKIAANHVSNKGFASRIYKQTQRFKRREKLNLKMGKTFEQILHQREHRMENKHMKSCSRSLAIMEMKIKTTITYKVTF